MSNNGRHLLLLDILGFSELVDRQSSEYVYSVIEFVLDAFSSWEKDIERFKTIYFSDTFLFYQEPNDYNEEDFDNLYLIGSMLFSAFLAEGIPTRGTIVFGEFEVRNDSQNHHQIYFGKALVEAYDAEKKEKWIGITIQSSAWRLYEEACNGIINDIAGDFHWIKRNDGTLLLNPFIRIAEFYEKFTGKAINNSHPAWNDSEFDYNRRGFRFLLEKASEYADNADFSSREAVKYHATVAFLRKIMGADMFAWAEQISSPENINATQVNGYDADSTSDDTT